MAKISISLPDALKLQLDAYAEAHQLSVSETVQQALEALLQPAAPVPPASPPAPPPASPEALLGDERTLFELMVLSLNQEVQELSRYLAAVSQQTEQHRQCLLLLQTCAAVRLPVPPPLPPRD